MAVVLGRKGGGSSSAPASASLFDAYAMLRDQKANNTQGGAGTAGSWQTRTLQTEVFDPDGIVSLASNEFTLQPGAYFIKGRAIHIDTNSAKLKIRNVTDGADEIIGMSHFAVTTDTTAIMPTVTGRLVVAGSAKAYSLMYQIAAVATAADLGQLSNYGVVEVYAEVEIWREAS